MKIRGLFPADDFFAPVSGMEIENQLEKEED